MNADIVTEQTPPRPRITVAAVLERDGRFLLVEERVEDQLRLNQPAGHLELNEDLLNAVVRETREETGWIMQPRALVGICLWQHPQQALSYLRFAFTGDVLGHDPSQMLDEGIEQAIWLNRDELLARRSQWRSPLVLSVIDDYLAGRRYSLDILRAYLPG